MLISFFAALIPFIYLFYFFADRLKMRGLDFEVDGQNVSICRYDNESGSSDAGNYAILLYQATFSNPRKYAISIKRITLFYKIEKKKYSSTSRNIITAPLCNGLRGVDSNQAILRLHNVFIVAGDWVNVIEIQAPEYRFEVGDVRQCCLFFVLNIDNKEQMKKIHDLIIQVDYFGIRATKHKLNIVQTDKDENKIPVLINRRFRFDENNKPVF
jgi:hypothetical protein